MIQRAETLIECALRSEGAESTKLLETAIETYRSAIGDVPEDSAAVGSLGMALRRMSQITPSGKARQIREEALSNLATALKLLPNKSDHLLDRCVILMEMAQCSDSSDRDRLFDEAEKALNGLERMNAGAGAYCLACLRALKGDAEGAMNWLKVSASHGTLPSRGHIEYDSDLALIRSNPTFIAWYSSLPQGKKT
jgi:tetratricopeptide (TPR) repeat protein